MEFDASYRFTLRRRMPWEGDLETLQSHVGDVRTRIQDAGAVERVVVSTDLPTAELTMDIRLFGANRQSVEQDLGRIVGSAIRDEGAYHQGLLSSDEELVLTPRLRSWSGLRTPTWHVRASSVQFRNKRGRDRRDDQQCGVAAG